MPVNKLGSASISVEADTGSFGKGLSTKLRAALATADREAKRAGKDIGKQIVDGIGDEILKSAPKIRAKINAMLKMIKVSVKVKVDVDVKTGRASLGNLGARLKGQFQSEVFQGLYSAGNGIRALFGNLIPTSLTKASLILLGFSFIGTAIAGAFNAAGREVLNVGKAALFLPAAIGVVLSSFAALKIGLSGVSDAIEAVFSRDPKKLAEALKGLTPSARSFVLEVKKALPVFDRIKRAAQESLFKPLQGGLTKIVANLGPTLTAGLSQVAASIGNLIANVGAFFTTPQAQQALKSLLTSTATIITALSGPMRSLVEALTNAAVTALPALEKVIGGGLGGIIQKLADWLNAAVSDGRFQKWLDSAMRTLSDIWYLIKEMIKLFAVLFDDANSEGDSFLKIVGDLIKWFREFASSNDGKYAMDGIATAAKLAGVALIGVIAVIGTIIAAIGSLIAAVKDALRWLAKVAEQGPVTSGATKAIKRLIPGHADGAIVRSPQIAALAENGRPEVVIPLTKPNRARQLAQDSGLTRMLRPNGSGSTTTQVFYLGERQIEARMVEIVDSRVDASVNDAEYGTRAA